MSYDDGCHPGHMGYPRQAAAPGQSRDIAVSGPPLSSLFRESSFGPTYQHRTRPSSMISTIHVFMAVLSTMVHLPPQLVIRFFFVDNT